MKKNNKTNKAFIIGTLLLLIFGGASAQAKIQVTDCLDQQGHVYQVSFYNVFNRQHIQVEYEDGSFEEDTLTVTELTKLGDITSGEKFLLESEYGIKTDVFTISSGDIFNVPTGSRYLCTIKSSPF